jgi:hypothetical protein
VQGVQGQVLSAYRDKSRGRWHRLLSSDFFAASDPDPAPFVVNSVAESDSPPAALNTNVR